MNYPFIADDYAKECQSSDANVCKWIKLQTARYLEMLEMAKSPKSTFYYSPAHVIDYLSFVEKIRHFEDGNWQETQINEDGEIDDSYYMEPWQIWVESAIQGFRRKPGGSRLVRRAVTLVPRKSDKSGQLARGLLYELCEGGGRATEILVSASSVEQVKRTLYEDIRLILETEPDLVAKYGIKFTQDNGIRTATGAILPITTKAKTLDGYNPSLAIFEEGAAGYSDVYRVVTSAFASKPNAMMRMITTAGQQNSGPAWDLLLEGKRLLTGKKKEDVFSFFSAFYTLDEEDYIDPESKSTNFDRLMSDDSLLEKANPMWGVSIDPERVKEDRQNAVRMPTERGEFVRTRFNVWAGSGVGLIEQSQWEACKRDIRIEEFVGLPCWIAVDMAMFNDMCAVVPMFETTDDNIVAFPYLYLPEEAPLARDPDFGAMMFSWAEAGYVKMTPGGTHNHGAITNDIKDLISVLSPRVTAFDPKQAFTIFQGLWESGYSVCRYENNQKTMTAPMQDFLERIASQRFWHDGNPVFAWHAQNTYGEKRANGSIMPRKESEHSMRKIDAISATVMANGVRMHPDFAVFKDKDDPYVSPYETGRVIGAD